MRRNARSPKSTIQCRGSGVTTVFAVQLVAEVDELGDAGASERSLAEGDEEPGAGFGGGGVVAVRCGDGPGDVGDERDKDGGEEDEHEQGAVQCAADWIHNRDDHYRYRPCSRRWTWVDPTARSTPGPSATD